MTALPCLCVCCTHCGSAPRPCAYHPRRHRRLASGLDRKATSISWLVVIGVRASSTHKLASMRTSLGLQQSGGPQHIAIASQQDVILGEDSHAMYTVHLGQSPCVRALRPRGGPLPVSLLRRATVVATSWWYSGLECSDINSSGSCQPAIHRVVERLGAITSRPVLGGLHHQYCRYTQEVVVSDPAKKTKTSGRVRQINPHFGLRYTTGSVVPLAHTLQDCPPKR